MSTYKHYWMSWSPNSRQFEIHNYYYGQWLNDDVSQLLAFIWLQMGTTMIYEVIQEEIYVKHRMQKYFWKNS